MQRGDIVHDPDYGTGIVRRVTPQWVFVTFGPTTRAYPASDPPIGQTALEVGDAVLCGTGNLAHP
jgi:hypothetical protein